MSAKSGVYLRAPGKATSPGAIVSVVVQTWQDRELDGSPGCTEARLNAVYVSASRKVRGHWSEPERQQFDTAAQFWRWLDRWASSNRKTYIFTPTASDTLTHLGFWELVDTFGAAWDARQKSKGKVSVGTQGTSSYTFRRLVLKGAPDIVDYSIRGRSFCWLSVRNYFHPDGGAAPRPAASPQARPGAARRRSAPVVLDQWASEAARWLDSFCDLSDWWLARDAGSWAPTAGAMAERFLRSRMAPKAVVTHRCPETQRLERLAAHRGRTSCWFYGPCIAPWAGISDTMRVPWGDYPPLWSDLIHIDVRSMYPYLLTVTPLPVQRMTHIPDPTVSQARDLCRTWLCTAAVRLDSPVSEYPHRRDDRVSYPVGKFTAYLSGGELKRAIDDGVVTAVHEIAVYKPGFPFKRAAEELLSLRMDAIAKGNEGWELFVKLMANSLTGKLAQKRTRWVERPRYPAAKRWGAWSELSADTGVMRRFRALAGLVWEMVREEHGTGLLTACYGHLTAACSLVMRGIRESLPPNYVVSQDTDGIWVRPEAAGILAAKGYEFGEQPGALRITARSLFSRFWGPKHYFAGRRWRLSGYGKPVQASDGFGFLDQASSNAVRSTPLAPPTTTVDTLRRVGLDSVAVDGGIGSDGWLIPRGTPMPAPAWTATDHVEQGDSDRKNEYRQSLFD